MTPISIDQNLDAYIFGCPVYNEEARGKLEHMGLEVPDKCACEKKQECCPSNRQNLPRGTRHALPD